VDISKFKPATWLMVIGGLGMFIFGLFFDWAKLEVAGFGVGSGGNAFDWTRGWISWILVVGVAVIAVLQTSGKLGAVKVPWNIVMVAATALATLLMLLLIITGPDTGGINWGRAMGLWLSFVSTVVAFVGSLLNFTGAGGDLKDLTDFKKIKGNFQQDS
jgi:hypothetical protein